MSWRNEGDSCDHVRIKKETDAQEDGTRLRTGPPSTPTGLEPTPIAAEECNCNCQALGPFAGAAAGIRQRKVAHR
eukprot:6183810-Pyramimonas_sp.AAC.1